MKRNFTKLLAALALLAFLMPCLTAVGQSTHTLGWGLASGSNSTNFTAITGSVTGILSFSCDKNNGTTNPAYSGNNNQLRLYYDSSGNGNGNSITITPATGVTITKAVINSSTNPAMKYYVDGGSATSISGSNGTYTISNISATSSLKIQNANTTNTQLRIETIVITYTSGGGTSYTVTAAKETGISTAYVAAGSSFSGTSTSVSVSSGGSATFQATVASGYTFDGWYNGSNRVSQNTTYTQTNITSALTLTAKATSSGGSGGGNGDYVLVSESQSDWSGDYVLAYNSSSTQVRVLKGKAGSNNYGDYVTVTPSGNTLAASDVEAYNISIEAVTYNNSTCYTLKQDGKYLGYTSTSTSGNNYLYFSTSVGNTPQQYYWTISYSGSTLTITNVYNTSRLIKWNNTSSQYRFACYTSGQQNISLYKKEIVGAYTVTCNTASNGTISASPTSADEGATVTITATPNTGYELTSLTYTPEGGSAQTINIASTPYTFTMPAANVTVNATFAKKNYTITYNTPTHGSITTGPTSAQYGDNVSIVTSPASGYQLQGITVTNSSNNQAVAVSGNGNSRSFTMPAANVSVVVTFEPIQYSVTCNTASNGTITASPTLAAENATVTITATPNTGYELTSLTYTPEGGSAQTINIASTPYTFTMPAANVTVNATFSLANYTVTCASPSNGTLSASPTNNVHYQDPVTVTATPNNGYQLTALTYTPASGTAQNIDIASTPYTFSMPAANVTVNATFQPFRTAHFSVNGTIDPSNDFTGIQGTAITFPSNPADIGGKTFVGWVTDEIPCINNQAPTFITSATMGNSDVSYYACYANVISGDATTATDVLTREITGVEENTTNYSNWNDITLNSEAVYAGNSAGDNNSIQLRTNQGTTGYSGIITTHSGGKATKVTIEWNSNTANNRELGVYGKNSAYSSTSDLYGTDQGTLLGTIARANSTELTIDGDYTYIGLRSQSGAMYLTSVSMEWTSGTPDTYSGYCTTVHATPTNLSTNNITSSSAQLSWTGEQQSYEVEVGHIVPGEETTTTETVTQTEDFESTTAVTNATGSSYNTVPSGWKSLSTNSSYYPHVYNGTDYFTMNGNCLFFAAANGSSAYAIMPQYTNLTALSFDYVYESSSGTLTVGYVTDNTSYSTFTAFTTTTCSSTTTVTTKSLTAQEIATVNSHNGYIAFKWTKSNSTWYSCGIDNVNVTYTQTTTTISPDTFVVDQTFNPNTSPQTVNDLNSNTEYQWHVRGIVDAQNNCYTEWSEMDTFTTLSGYSITATVNPAEGGTVSGAGTYNPNASCTLTAEANPGYTFTNWTKDGVVVSTNSTYIFTVTESGEYVANFTINSYTVNVTAGANGSATQSGNGTYTHGTECTITATAATGYHFVNWTENGILVSTENPYTFQVEDDRDLAANFAINSYAVTIEANPSNGGTLTGDASGNYNHGATVTVTATPSTGYHFVNWTVDGTEVSTSATLSNYAITDECTIIANFAINSYAVTIEASQGGSISGSTSGNYNHGATVNVTATATTGYHFVNWTVDDVEESTNTALTYTITGACTISANFEPDTFVIGATVAPENSGSVEGAGTYDYNSTCTLTATPNVGYTFVNWTKNGVGVSNSATYSFTVTGDASYVANFQRNSYSITVAAMPSNGGIATGAGTYNHGVSVTVNATPNAGYQFVNWTVNNNVVSTSASYTFTATEALNLVANFLYAVVPPTVATNSQVTNVTGSSAQCGGQITSTGYGYISAYGFCWNTTGEPTIQDSHYQVGISTTDPFTYNITGLNANTLYYVRAYATNQEGTAYGNEVTFATMAQVTTAAVTAHTLDAIMGGSWVGGSGDATVTACGVEYKEATASAWQTATMSVPASGTSFSGTVSGLTANTNYVVRAFVTNGGGTSYGTEVPFTTIGYFAVSATVNPAESGTVSFDPEGIPASGSQTAEIGNGTASQRFFPFHSRKNYSYDEMIYEHTDAMIAGKITKISFHYMPSTDAPNHKLAIYLKNVGETSAIPSEQPIGISGAVLCFEGTVSASNANQWVEITLSTPFQYSGSGNILVAVYNSTNNSKTCNWYSTDVTGAAKCLCYFSDNEINLANLSGGEYLSDASCLRRPDIRFTIEDPNSVKYLYPWGENVTLTAEPATGYQFLNWTEDGVVVSTDNPYTLESIEANRELVANFAICKTFTNADGDHEWDNAANWVPAGVPNGEDVVIAAAATISNSTVATVNNISINGGSITIEDGGQLKHNNNGVVVTTKKSITGYGSANANTNKGYYLISSPVDGIAYNNVTGLATTHYDLYKFVSNNEESGELREWVHVDGNLQAKKGYLYASETTTTLGITGTVAHSATDIEETLTYNEGFRFGGWNLVGNPFVCDAYVTRSSNEMNYYVLNHEAGYDEFTTASSTDPIAPMSGLMVQATATGQTITYSRTAPSKGSGILNMDVRKTMERGIATLDRARVRFGEGINLEKFQLDARHTKISIPEGSNEYSVYYADGAGTIPVNFKAQDNGRYTLDFSTEEIGFNYLHLIDNMNGNDVDLLQTPYYAFDAKSTDYASRFTLVFATGNNDGESTFAFFNNGNWIINNDGKAELQVVDALGRILSSETISGSCSKAINVAPGVYMLRLINGNDVKVQKVVVRR